MPYKNRTKIKQIISRAVTAAKPHRKCIRLVHRDFVHSTKENIPRKYLTARYTHLEWKGFLTT